MDDDFEILEFQFPSVFAVGKIVRVVKLCELPEYPNRPIKKSVVGEIGVVSGHRTRYEQRWNRVKIDGSTMDFLTQELQLYPPN